MPSIDLTIPAVLDRTGGVLAELAHEINVRLQKADDHRLSASLKLAEAKEACAKEGVSFKSWVAAEIKQIGYIEATKLAKIGAAPDPAKALEDNRNAARAGMKKGRTKGVANVSNSTSPAASTVVSFPPARYEEAICIRVREAISALSGLSPPAAIVGYLRGTDHAIIVGERLPAAAEWLAEFTEIWSNENAD